MFSRNNHIEFKPVVVGEEDLHPIVKDSLYVSTIYGVRIHTDSEDMHRCLRLIGASTDESFHKTDTDFYYVTRMPLPFHKQNGEMLQQLQVNYPGDIYMSPQMDRFYFWGIDKLGTLASMIYGIRALSGIKQGRLGLHSALFYDLEQQQAHLIVGKNRVGKSSVCQLMERSSDRFLMISDDWNEVNMQTRTVDPMSVVFSPEYTSQDYELAFESFGKQFFWKHNVRPYPELRLGKIFELVGSEEELQDELFLVRSLAHIPLLVQKISSEMLDSPHAALAQQLEALKHMQTMIKDAYRVLCATTDVHRVANVKGGNSLEETALTILNKLNN